MAFDSDAQVLKVISMKLSYRDIEPFVKNPSPAARVILVYGPDQGLMRERAQMMGRTVVPDLSDPFNVIRLSADSIHEDPVRLQDEAHAISMMGGNRLISIFDAGDKLTPYVKDYLESPNDFATIILEAGELSPRSSLRKLCESAPNAAAVPCYVEDERDLARFIRGLMQDSRLTIDHDAVNWLTIHISGDRAKVRGELEKIITYKGAETSPVSLEDVQACCGEAGAQGIDDLVYATAGNRAEAALQTYQQLLDDGVNFIVVVRALQSHFRKLHMTRAKMEKGDPVDVAVKGLRPPLFFKQAPLFKAQASRWSLKNIEIVQDRLMDLEAQCKTTGSVPETLCAQAVLSIGSMR